METEPPKGQEEENKPSQSQTLNQEPQSQTIKQENSHNVKTQQSQVIKEESQPGAQPQQVKEETQPGTQPQPVKEETQPQPQLIKDLTQPEVVKESEEKSIPLSFEAARKNYMEKWGVPVITLSYGQRFHIRIETKRLVLESMGVDDAYCLHKYLWGESNVMKLFATGATKTLEETEKRVSGWAKRWSNEDPFAGMNVRDKYTGDYIGYIVMGYGEQQNSSETAYAIKEGQWNKGYGYESIGATVLFLSNILKKTNYKVNGKQEFQRIIATSNILNPASKRILQKLGFGVYKESEKFGGKREHFQLVIK